MTAHRPSNNLSPALAAVLNGLNVNLEAELNRYRRTRHTHSSSEDDIFADLDAIIDASSALQFRLDSAQSSIAVPAVTLSDAPPPPPPNKKLSHHLLAAKSRLDAEGRNDINSDRGSSEGQAQAIAPIGALITRPSSGELLSSQNPLAEAFVQSAAGQSIAGKARQSSAAFPSTAGDVYLASSEKLIESLTDVADMPEPVNFNPEPRRKTVSLMAGAALGLLALVAGLGASYVMSNPDMAQTLAGGFKSEGPDADALSKRPFDPPGPDLSAQEFVDLKLDNLSSLNVRASLDPLATSATPVPLALPPIEGAAENAPQSVLPSVPSVAAPTATQALSIPAGANYYVTVPFSTEQGLIEVRKAVEEAFVRQFSDGNRIQLAVFDNPQMAQSFMTNLQAKGVQAQLYGPTAE